MKTYTTKPNEDLGSIARKFGMPSWKYLYQINKAKIGNNPDLLKEGTVLEIPQWDSTSGDERIRAKGADPFKYTGGLRYAYPWVPLSVSLVDEQGNQLIFDKDELYIIKDATSGNILCEGTIKSGSAKISVLIPDSKNIQIEVGDLILSKNLSSNANIVAEQIEIIELQHTYSNGEAAQGARYSILNDKNETIAQGILDHFGKGQARIKAGQKIEIIYDENDDE